MTPGPDPTDDAPARQAALDVRRSFIVQAPAGSGKTELLVRRCVGLLGVVDEPEEVLAITFTRKAAAEMRARVLAQMPASREVAHRLRIETIDALCAGLVRRMPVRSRFGARSEIVEDASELYREAAARTLSELSPPAVRLLSHLDNDIPAAAALLAGMLGRRDQWLRKTGAAPTRAQLESSLGLERRRLLDRARALRPDASEELARGLLTAKGTWKKRSREALALSGNEPLRAALFALCSMPPGRYTDAQWEALEAILALLTPAVQQLLALFMERNQFDFTEVAHGALRALGSAEEPTELLLAIDARVRHILVDEFQDTSISQWELLSLLTAGWQPEDGRTVFAVGDPMQSIYRFREAEVGLFLRARREGLPSVRLEPLTLSANFRSQASLVAWFNATFPRVLPAAEDEAAGAVPYAPASSTRAALSGAAVAWHCFEDRRSEARRVLELVREAPGKKAILVRNRSHLDAIVPALKEAGVRFRAVEIEQLGERPVVQDLFALTRALAHPGDRVAWLAILRAPWTGLSLVDLHLLAAGSDATVWEALQDLAALSADGRARAGRLREVLRPLIAGRRRSSLRESVEAAWLALGGPACVADRTDLEDAEAYLDELERLEVAGQPERFPALEERLHKLFALPDVSAGPEAVEIMTIHKAKGLQFDCVIVPGLDRGLARSPKPLFAWKQFPDGRLLLAPIHETGAGRDPIYDYVRSLEKEAEDVEAGRLLYVAATRARSRLHLLACVGRDEGGTPREPGRRSLLAAVWFEAKEHLSPQPAPAGPAQGRGPLPGAIRRLPPDFVLPAAPPAAAWAVSGSPREEAAPEFSWAGETARHVGTVVHRWLQRIAEEGIEGWDAARCERLRPLFGRELQRRGVPAAETGAAAGRVAGALAGALADERGRWLLGPHSEARSEYRIRVRDGNAVRMLVVDRTFRDANGERWIVDFKTGRHEGGNVEAFLDRERERYAPQLERYAKALGPARLGLYFPLLRGWREWALAP